MRRRGNNTDRPAAPGSTHPPRSRPSSPPTRNGEFVFLGEVRKRFRGRDDVLLGPGDDCALLRLAHRDLLVTVDGLTENVHFHRSWLSPLELGRRLVAVNASDVAAMGGTPLHAVVQLLVPPDYSGRDLRALQRGIETGAAAIGAALVGGNVSRARELSLVLTLLASAPEHPLRRDGARPGDLLFVTGTLGDAALAVAGWKAGRLPPAPLRKRFVAPTPRLSAGQVLAQQRLATAMIDISDGLLQDLGHLCEASQVGAELTLPALPRSAAARRLAGADLTPSLAGGEDYELLFAVSPDEMDRLERSRSALGCDITPIGRVVPGKGVRLFDSAGGLQPQPATAGFDHFRREI